jgi:anti-sigma-K factor RskA
MMMIADDETPDCSEIELLLPWHAAGTLNPREAERVEAALASDEELRRRYHLVRDELAETIHLNESLGAPSARGIERVMARIEAEAAAPTVRPASFGVVNWISAQLSRLTPPTLAWAAAAAVLVMVVQAGLLAGLYVERGPLTPYQTASVAPAPELAGSYALIGFVPEANAADVTRFLETYRIEIVSGPRAGGLFKVKVGPADMTRNALQERVTQMQQERAVVHFAAVAD